MKMFKKKEWGKWQDVSIENAISTGVIVLIQVREEKNTGEKQFKNVKIGSNLYGKSGQMIKSIEEL